MKRYELADLEKCYREDTDSFREFYSEMRSNVLLHAGEHYSKKTQSAIDRSGGGNTVEAQKLRITKNLMHKVVRKYIAGILDYAPGVACEANNPTELQDQKVAEIAQNVWKYEESKEKLKAKIRNFAQDFVSLGECAVKVTYDPNKGDFVGYHQATDEAGNPVVDEMGQPVADEQNAAFSGGFIHERLLGFNLWVENGAKSFDESPYIGIRKMCPVDDLCAKFPEATKDIEATKDDEFIVFDSARSSYHRDTHQALVKELYVKPCPLYPQGYFYIWITNKILAQGELPFGIFPIVWKGFDEYPAHPRGRSIIKIARPYQAELNRAASQMATHQVTLGDDKIIYQKGASLSQGSLLPGVRGIAYTGAEPTILAGRDGSQFQPHVLSQREELYDAVMLNEENEEKQSNLADAYQMLYRSLKDQRKNAVYAEKFEEFLCEWAYLFLELARKYLSDEEILAAVGRAEQANIAEFRNGKKNRFSIKIKPQSETVEDKLGRQLTFTQLLQYVGNQLPPEMVGKIARNMPFANNEEIFADMTIDYDNAKNDMLAMERGEEPMFNENDNHEYMIDRLSHRMRQPDFRYLPPNVQGLYQQKLALHQQAFAADQQAVIDAKNEYIPVGGAMVGVDFYVPHPSGDPNKIPRRVRLPYQAIEWLIKHLESQGMSQTSIDQMNAQQVKDVFAQIHAGASPQQGESDGSDPIRQPSFQLEPGNAG